MANKYACFISYRHPKSVGLQQRIEELEEALREELDGLVEEDPYRDPKLKPGEQYNASFAEKICHSYCLLVIYTSTYKDSAYCRAELELMMEIERKRLEKLDKAADKKLGMIIPLIFKRIEGENLPEQLRPESVHHADISAYTILPKKLSEVPEVRSCIHAIAQHIAQVKKMMIAAGFDVGCLCSDIEIKPDVPPWTCTIPSPPQQGFPLRTGPAVEQP